MSLIERNNINKFKRCSLIIEIESSQDINNYNNYNLNRTSSKPSMANLSQLKSNIDFCTNSFSFKPSWMLVKQNTNNYNQHQQNDKNNCNNKSNQLQIIKTNKLNKLSSSYYLNIQIENLDSDDESILNENESYFRFVFFDIYFINRISQQQKQKHIPNSLSLIYYRFDLFFKLLNYYFDYFITQKQNSMQQKNQNLPMNINKSDQCTVSSSSSSSSCSLNLNESKSKPIQRQRPGYIIERDCHIFGGCVEDEAEDEFFVSSGAVYQSWPYVYEPGFKITPLVDFVQSPLSKSANNIYLNDQNDSSDLEVNYNQNNHSFLNSPYEDRDELPSYSLENFGINLIHVKKKSNKKREKSGTRAIQSRTILSCRTKSFTTIFIRQMRATTRAMILSL